MKQFQCQMEQLLVENKHLTMALKKEMANSQQLKEELKDQAMAMKAHSLGSIADGTIPAQKAVSEDKNKFH